MEFRYTKQTTRLIAILTLLMIASTNTLIVAAQNSTTPTPAPTKTSSPDNIETEQDQADPQQGSENRRQFEALTQNDLNVITGNVQRPNGIVWHNSKLYVVCNGDWTIYEIDDTTGSTRTYIYGVRNGHALHTETNENGELTIWVPDFDQNSLLAVNAVRAPSPVATSLSGPWGIAQFDADRFLITSFGGNQISLINRNGEIEELLSGLRSPTGITHDEGIVYFANSGSARRAIEWIDTSSEDISEPQPLVSGLQNTTGITLASDNYLYFAFSLGTRGVVGRVDPVQCREQGGCSNDEVEIVLYTELAAPLAGLTISPDMRMFVHTMFRPEIYWVQIPTNENTAAPLQTPEAQS